MVLYVNKCELSRIPLQLELTFLSSTFSFSSLSSAFDSIESRVPCGFPVHTACQYASLIFLDRLIVSFQFSLDLYTCFGANVL